MEDYSKILIDLRAKTGLSQGELADKIGVTQQTLSNVESGKGAHGVTAAKIKSFLRAYNYNIESGLGEDAETTTANPDTDLSTMLLIIREQQSDLREANKWLREAFSEAQESVKREQGNSAKLLAEMETQRRFFEGASQGVARLGESKGDTKKIFQLQNNNRT